jgi:hypothetical protein
VRLQTLLLPPAIVLANLHTEGTGGESEVLNNPVRGSQSESLPTRVRRSYPPSPIP